MLQKYEHWTGHILTREELDSGFLKEELIDDDYVINIPVSFTFFSSFPSLNCVNVFNLVCSRLPAFLTTGHRLSLWSQRVVRTNGSHDFQLSPTDNYVVRGFSLDVVV